MIYFSGKQLQMKWRHIKDAYVKSRRAEKNVKSGTSFKSSKPYVYSKSLRFLDNLQIQRKIHDSLPSGGPECSGISREVQEGFQQRKKTKTSQVVVNELIEFKNNQGQKPEEDADRLFLLSLLPDVKSLNGDQKRALKMKFLQAIDDVKSQRTLYGIKQHM